MAGRYPLDGVPGGGGRGANTNGSAAARSRRDHCTTFHDTAAWMRRYRSQAPHEVGRWQHTGSGVQPPAAFSRCCSPLLAGAVASGALPLDARQGAAVETGEIRGARRAHDARDASARHRNVCATPYPYTGLWIDVSFFRRSRCSLTGSLSSRLRGFRCQESRIGRRGRAARSTAFKQTNMHEESCARSAT